ncbi:MAG: MMPL family transporter [Clostridiales bacterium]|nr:MMPL family transporter [Clostridiales bacterium]
MLSKYSVRRPFTVVVAVIIVLILGVVSYTHMGVDLIPNMNMPYALVTTAYAGASPEEVESAIVEPVEQSMASISNVKSIQSIAAENYGMVILEFNQSANMDTALIEMRESLSMIESGFPSGAGSPIIVKMNPDMLPIIQLTVSKEGMDRQEISAYIENEVMPELDSIPGVASASATGLLTNMVQIELSDEKIAALNDRLSAYYTEQVETASAEGKKQVEAAGAAAAELTAAYYKAQAEAASLEKQLETASLEAMVKAAAEGLSQRLQGLEGAGTGRLEGILSGLDGDRLQNLTPEELAALLAQAGLTPAGSPSGPSQVPGGSTHEPSTAAQPALPGGFELPSGVSLPAGISIPEGVSIPDGVSLPGGVSIPDGVSFPSDLSIPSGLIPGDGSLPADLSRPQGGGIDQAQWEQTLQAVLEEAQAAASSDGEVQRLAGEYAAAKAKEIALSEQASAAKTTAMITAAALSGAALPAFTGLPVTKETVGQLIAAQNMDMPSGSVSVNGVSYLVRTGEKIKDYAELEGLPLMELPGVGRVYLKDVAELVKTDDGASMYGKVNGRDAVILSLQKQPDYSTADVSTSVQERLEQLAAEQEGFTYTVLMDQGEYVHMMIDTIIKNLLIGGLLAILILFVFLKSVKPTVIVGLSIVISVITAFVCMYFAGINLNIISMSGLALSVGMLVDNSIVVIENIFRMRGLGKDVKAAAVEGAGQMAGAITASTITTIVVFVPIFFTEGITRQLFTDMALTVAFSLLASLLVALTLVPAAAAGIMKKEITVRNKTFEKMTEGYVRLLDLSLRHKWAALALVIVLFAGSLAAAANSGSELFPAGDTGSITVSVDLPDDYTRQQTTAALDQLSDALLSIEDIETVGLMNQEGGGMMMGGGTSAYVALKEKRSRSTDEVVDIIRQKTAGFDFTVSAGSSGADLSALTGGQIVVDVYGRELDDLRQAAQMVAGAVESTEGTVEVSDGLGKASSEIRIAVDKEKAASHNLTVAQVLMAVSGRLKTGSSVTSIADGEVSYDLYVKSGSTENLTDADIGDIEIDASGMTASLSNLSGSAGGMSGLMSGLSGMGGTGGLSGMSAAGGGGSEEESEPVRVKDVASITRSEGFSSIRRDEKQRCVQVTASLESGYNIGRVGEKLETALEALQLPAGCSYKIAGENENMQQSFHDLYLMLLLAVIFIYLVMVAQFQSLLSPFIVMFTIPLAFTGGFFALALCGMSVSVVSLVGMVVLVGVVVNNGIVYVDCVNQRRAEGLTVHEALLSAARTRLRPICMTALTTIIALLAGALDQSGGADMTRPMSVTIVGGLVYATFLTLFLVPTMYALFHRKEKK